jgi:RNA polymerase sigma-70 factor (ECF subfamily)
MFACAHPAIEPGIRAPLILQTVLGFDAATIASAFLVPPATMAQRLVRAKARIRQAGIPFSIPERADLAERLGAVLAAIYATFSEGWGDAHDGESRQRNLAREGIWLGRLMAALMPEEPEALSLLALMLFAEARRPARRNEKGDYVPLAEQDTNRWDHALLGEAEGFLAAAGRLEGLGRYQLEAAVQGVHAARRILGRTDWRAIVQLYDALALMSASPVVAINRAVALAEIEGARAGLAALATVQDAPGIADYQPYWAALAGLSAKAGDAAGAVEAYDRAVGLASDDAVRRFLLERKARLIG